MSIGNLQIGSYLPFTAGQAQLVKTGTGALLGFIGTVAGSATIYDNTTASAPVIVASVPISVGWNNLSVAFGTGLYIALTTAAGTAVWV